MFRGLRHSVKNLMERAGSPLLGNIFVGSSLNTLCMSLSDKHVEGAGVLRSCPGKAWIDFYHLQGLLNQPGKAQRQDSGGQQITGLQEQAWKNPSQVEQTTSLP